MKLIVRRREIRPDREHVLIHRLRIVSHDYLLARPVRMTINKTLSMGMWQEAGKRKNQTDGKDEYKQLLSILFPDRFDLFFRIVRFYRDSICQFLIEMLTMEHAREYFTAYV